MKNKTLVVNFFGGPGIGKSTLASSVFSKLKLAGVHCEYATEYAKDLTWEESFSKLKNQILVLGEQLQRIERVIDKVDVVITDSPILLSCVYGRYKSKSLKDFVLELSDKHWNLNFLIERQLDYVSLGRNESFEEALQKDKEILAILLDSKQEYQIVNDVSEQSAIYLTEYIQSFLIKSYKNA